jgi:sugar lactone lactonase YvrE
VPKGEVFDFIFDQSAVFPGTSRKITIYVPAQYRADKPACVYVGLDALNFEAPTVFDNLIHKGAMPVTIGIGVQPGAADSAQAPDNPRFNRSNEFDALNGNLARFLLDEILPEVERRQTSDGRTIRLSKDPNDRAIGGASTGGIGSFTVAWERPDAFRRVFTAIGTFVGMRGGDRYPVLVRKTEPKPIRIFMQDGSNDQLIGFIGEVGDWWLSNQTMLSALEFAGYQVAHVWGEGKHSGKHPTAIFPEAMRWLWKDWPQPITAGQSQNTIFNGSAMDGKVLSKGILLPSEAWQAVAGDYQATGPLAANAREEIIFQDEISRKTRKIGTDGTLTEFSLIRNPYAALVFGAEERAYVADGAAAKISVVASNGESTLFAEGLRTSNLLVTHKGNLYATDSDAGKVWLIRAGGKKILLDEQLSHPAGIVLSPDGLWLAVAESRTHWGYSYRVQPDGTVRHKHRFYWFHVPDEADDSGAGAWAADTNGLLYAATRMGVQVFDRNGRSRAILPVPGGAVTALAFGGPEGDMLYVICANRRIYVRQLQTKGVPSWSAPIKLPEWIAG